MNTFWGIFIILLVIAFFVALVIGAFAIHPILGIIVLIILFCKLR